MVKYTEINTVIVDRLKSKFNDIEITSRDVSEGFKRPSFFIIFDNIKSSNFMNVALDREITVRIQYFSKDKNKNKIELLNMQDDLNELFLENNLLKINDYTIVEIEELELDIVDKVLHCYFDIKLSEDYNRVDNSELIEELEYTNKIER